MKIKLSNSLTLPLERDAALKTMSYVLPIIGFTILTSVGAAIRIPLPFTPVPITLQTLFVLLSGLMLGANRGAMSQALYLIWGISGAPLFAGGVTGLAILSGPTGGYLIGFIISAWLLGRISRNTTNWNALVFQTFSVSLIILALGAAWLSVVMNLTIINAIKLGALPFLLGDVLKVIATVSLFKLWNRIGE